MAACPTCGEANPAHARFCLACGTPLDQPLHPARCGRRSRSSSRDVVDSTPLGEQLDAETYRRVISRYFIEVSRVLERHGGTVEKFIGDAVMAVFGIPVRPRGRRPTRRPRRRQRCGGARRAERGAARASTASSSAIRTGHQHRRGRRRRPGRRPRFATGERRRRGAAAGGGGEPRRDPDRRARRTGSCATPCSSSRSSRWTLKGKQQPVERLAPARRRLGRACLRTPARRAARGRERELAQLRDAFERGGRETRRAGSSPSSARRASASRGS